MDNEFNFQIGDVVDYCDDLHFVIENNGTTGVVNPIGENYYIRNFYWDFMGSKTKFVRKPTDYELMKLGLTKEG